MVQLAYDHSSWTRLCEVVMFYQAINNLAAAEENKVHIVEAGALPHYVKFLSAECEENLQKEAVNGLWLLASIYKDIIVAVPGCVKG